MKKIFLSIISLLILNIIYAQERLHVPTQVCRFDYTELPGNSDIIVNEPDINVQRIWSELLSVSGMSGANASLKKSNVKRFESFNQNGKGWIIYDADLFNQWTSDVNFKWMVAFALGHELGHFALGHNLSNGSNKKWEADADEWACLQLCKMHANSENASKAVLIFVPELGTITGYPTKKERLDAISKYYRINNCSNKTTCPGCHGLKKEEKRCTSCRGTGDGECVICHGRNECDLCKRNPGKCSKCKGTGEYEHHDYSTVPSTIEIRSCNSCTDGDCKYCRGTGKCKYCNYKGKVAGGCDKCNGSGKVEVSCSVCNGKGYISSY